MKSEISIMMITKNRANFIGAAILSVIEQTFKNWELIIVDGNSKDNTEEVVNNFAKNDPRIKFFKRPEVIGVSKSRNAGLSLSTGKYVAILDSDDKWIDKDKLQKQFDFLEKNPDYVLISSNMRIIDNDGKFIKNTDFETEDLNIRKKILISNQIPHSAVMYRKELAEKVGGYGTNYSEDLELFLKLGKFGKMKNLKEVTTSYTKHPGGNSQKKKILILMTWNQYLMILKNFGKYPHWFRAVVWAKLRFIKSLF